MTSTEEPAREFLRHTVATLAYRGGKAVRGASPETAAFRAGPSTRTPGQILAHVNDLLDWAGSLAKGQHSFRESDFSKRFGGSTKSSVPSTPRFSRGEAVSGPRRGRSDARRPDRAASAPRGSPRKGGELLPGGHRRGPHRPRAGRAPQGVRVSEIIAADAAAGSARALRCWPADEEEA